MTGGHLKLRVGQSQEERFISDGRAVVYQSRPRGLVGPGLAEARARLRRGKLIVHQAVVVSPALSSPHCPLLLPPFPPHLLTSPIPLSLSTPLPRKSAFVPTLSKTSG